VSQPSLYCSQPTPTDAEATSRTVVSARLAHSLTLAARTRLGLVLSVFFIVDDDDDDDDDRGGTQPKLKH